jgi:hypothetical protein
VLSKLTSAYQLVLPILTLAFLTLTKKKSYETDVEARNIGLGIADDSESGDSDHERIHTEYEDEISEPFADDRPDHQSSSFRLYQ